MNIWGKLAELVRNIRHNQRFGRGAFRCRECGVIAFESYCSDEHFEAYMRKHPVNYP
jgi:ribosomal protein S14